MQSINDGREKDVLPGLTFMTCFYLDSQGRFLWLQELIGELWTGENEFVEDDDDFMIDSWCSKLKLNSVHEV